MFLVLVSAEVIDAVEARFLQLLGMVCGGGVKCDSVFSNSFACNLLL